MMMIGDGDGDGDGDGGEDGGGDGGGDGGCDGGWWVVVQLLTFYATNINRPSFGIFDGRHPQYLSFFWGGGTSQELPARRVH